jgi:hypothetical protein
MISISDISLRSFNHEFPRFEKKHDPWSDPIKKTTPTINKFVSLSEKGKDMF